eukprot:44827_1
MAYTYTIEKYNSHGLSNDVLLISRFNTKVQFPLLQGYLDSYGEAQHELLNDYCGGIRHKSANTGPDSYGKAQHEAYMKTNKIYQCSSSDPLTTTSYQQDNCIDALHGE